MSARAYLDAVRKRCEAAVVGPWYYAADFDVDALPMHYATTIAQVVGEGSTHLPRRKIVTMRPLTTDTDASGRFIAHARTDLPKLERIARLALDYAEAHRAYEPYEYPSEAVDSDLPFRLALETARKAFFAALESLP